MASSCRVFLSDRFMPVLVKSLRSQRVRHVAAGEYHTAVLTEVSTQKSLFLTALITVFSPYVGFPKVNVQFLWRVPWFNHSLSNGVRWRNYGLIE